MNYTEKKIYKFALATSATTIQIPYSGRILFFQCQFGIPCVWVEFNDGDQFEKTERLHVVPTGMPFESTWLYVGTTLDGPFVWHLYSEPTKQEMVH